jgi:hypothetical protein
MPGKLKITQQNFAEIFRKELETNLTVPNAGNIYFPSCISTFTVAHRPPP